MFGKDQQCEILSVDFICDGKAMSSVLMEDSDSGIFDSTAGVNVKNEVVSEGTPNSVGSTQNFPPRVNNQAKRIKLERDGNSTDIPSECISQFDNNICSIESIFIKEEDLSVVEEIDEALLENPLSDSVDNQDLESSDRSLLAAALSKEANIRNDIFDIVNSLLELPFLQRDIAQQKVILRIGRPKIHLTASQDCKKANKTFTRSFNADNYLRYDWLCGSHCKQTLFCWPCLLLDREGKKSVWSTTGYADFKNLSRALSRHDNSKDHMSNHCQLKRMEKAHSLIKENLTEHAHLTKAQFNETVRLNRSVMRILIDAMIYLHSQGLEQSRFVVDVNKESHYDELVALLLKHSPSEIQSHYRTIKPMLTAGSKTVQNELTECVQDVMLEKIEADLRGAPFFSCQMGDTTDLTSKIQSYLIVRFVDSSGQTIERFWGFFDFSEDSKASGFFSLLESLSRKFNIESKLIGQTFDGACMTAEELTLLQTRVKSVAPKALLTHCNDCRLSRVLGHGTKNISECRKFFSQVISMAAYFHQSSVRSRVTVKFIECHFPQIVDPYWYTKNVNLICKYFSDLRRIFNAIIDDPLQSAESHTRAMGFLDVMSQFDFAFLTLIFKDIFDKADALSDALQERSQSIHDCIKRVEDFKSHFITQQNDENANEYISKAVELISMPSVSSCDLDFIQAKKTLYHSIISNIVLQVTERFCDLEKLLFLELVHPSKFSGPKYRGKFPDAALESLLMSYPDKFHDVPRLRCELEVMYSDTVYRQKSVQEIIEHMRSADVHKILKEAYKLMSLVASISATALFKKRRSSPLQKIEVQLCSAAPQESILSLLSIEKELLRKMMAEEDFYTQVIIKFTSKKSCKINLAFKP